MELYNSEEEQVEAIKDWLRKYGTALIAVAVIVIAGLVGWHYYQQSQNATKESASAGYADVVKELQSQGVKAESKVQSFIYSNKSSEYSVLAALQLAKVQADAGNLDEALAQLEWAKTDTKDEALKSIAAYRVARIQEEQGHYESALSELASIKSTAWSGRVSELKGDIALKQGKTDEAYKAYVEAQQSGDTSPVLKMKLDDLAKQGQ
ncbi:YfgM family protein [Vibrio sp. S4M6]|uniref:YfgM family protein n=1 Tax=Vibrio sinus TaxID=2946865 RepID=UPI00202AAFAD|nr:YfgM family protein [Vibrio sinus]